MNEKQSKQGKMQKEEYFSTFLSNQLKMTFRQEFPTTPLKKQTNKQPQDKLRRKSKRWGEG